VPAEAALSRTVCGRGSDRLITIGGNLGCAPGWGRSLRTMTRIPAGLMHTKTASEVNAETKIVGVVRADRDPGPYSGWKHPLREDIT
jgi:hypothetical protein